MNSITPLFKDTKQEKSFWVKNKLVDHINFDQNGIKHSFTKLKPSTKTITLRVSEIMLQQLKMMANKRDMPYQSLIKNILQEKIESNFSRHTKHILSKTSARLTLGVLVGAIVSYTQFLSPIKAEGVSMTPQFYHGQYLILDRINYKTAAPQRDDVVVFASPSTEGVDYFKRIVGLPGETVTLRDGIIYINGQSFIEHYATGKTQAKAFLKEDNSVTIPLNSYFVLGDNREESIDSRAFGFVSKDSIKGKVSLCYWNCN